MSIDKATTPISEYIGDGLANTFGLVFPAGSSSELLIYLRYVGTDAVIAYALPGNDTELYPMQPLTEGIDYQLSNLNIPSVYGSLSLIDAGQQWIAAGKLATDWNLIIRYDLDAFQPSSFRDLGVHAPLNFEKALDRLTMVLKGMKYRMFDAVLATEVIDTQGKGIKIWVTGANYFAGDFLLLGDDLYRCLADHVAGATFVGDAAYWNMLLDDTMDAKDAAQTIVLEATMDTKDDAQTIVLEGTMDSKDAAQSVVLEASMTAKDDVVRSEFAAADLIIQNAVDAIEVKTDNITVTQPVNLDEMEAAIAGGGSGTISEWTTGILYAVDAIIWETEDFYRCITQHTSGATFAGDAANWNQMSDKLTGAEIKALYELEPNAYTDAKDTAITAHIAATAAHGVTGNIVGTTDAQALTNKTISLSKITVKSDTLVNLTTYAATATNGELLYSTDTKEYYGIKDGALVPLGGGEGGGIAEWVTATDYEVGNVIWEGSEIYVCNVDHTSGATFIGDVAKWDELSPQLTATEIETLYEGLADTNKYTNAEKAKIGFVTVTSAVDLDTIDTNVDSLLDINQDRGEPSGFIRDLPNTNGILELSPDGTIIHRINELGVFSTSVATHPAYDAGITAGQFYDGTLANARELRLSPKTGTDLEVYIKGIKFVKATGETVVLTDVTGIQYVYFSDAGVLSATTIFDYDFLSVTPIVSLVYGNATTQELVTFADERHGIVMDGFTHRYHHFTEGAHYYGGMDIAGLVDGVSTHGTMSEGYLYDEDLYDVIPEQTTMPFWYIDGTEWRIVQDGNELGLINGADTYVSYNENVAGNFQLTEITGVLNTTIMFILATNDKVTPYVKVLGQNLYGSATAARDAIGTELASLVTEGLPTPEFVFTAAYIIRRDGNLEALDDGSTHVDLRTIKVNAQGAQSTAIVDHRKTTHREDADQHPIKSITDLKNRITTHDYALLEGSHTPIANWDITGILGASFTLDADEAYIWAVDNDNGAEVTIDFPLSWEHRNGDMHKLTAPFVLTGTDDVIELELWDKTNGVLISTIIPSGDDPLIHSYMPLETCEEITYKLKAITAGVASLKIDKMVFSDKFYESGVATISETTEMYDVTGYGTVDTKIASFSTVRSDTSDKLYKITTTASNGTIIEVTGAEKLNLAFTFEPLTASHFGVSLNSVALTTNITGLTKAEVLSVSYGAGSSEGITGSCNVKVTRGDKLRLHGQGVAQHGTIDLSSFSITATASSATHQFEDSFEQGHNVGKAIYNLSADYTTTNVAYTLPSLSLTSSVLSGRLVQNTANAPSLTILNAAAGAYKINITGYMASSAAEAMYASIYDGTNYLSLQKTYLAFINGYSFVYNHSAKGDLNLDFMVYTGNASSTYQIKSSAPLEISVSYEPPSTESSSVRSLVVSSVLENDFDVDASSAGVLSNFNGADDWCTFDSITATGQYKYKYNENIFSQDAKFIIEMGDVNGSSVAVSAYPYFTVYTYNNSNVGTAASHTIFAKKSLADRSDRTAAMVNGKDVVKANHKTTEFDTGEKWIDGRTIYGRSFTWTGSTSSTFTIATIDTGLDVISIDSIGKSGKWINADYTTLYNPSYDDTTGIVEIRVSSSVWTEIRLTIKYVK